MNAKHSMASDAPDGLAGVDDLSSLAAVAREGSFLAAAQSLGVATSTVARRVSALEARLGLPLVERRTDGARLTPAGREAVALAGRVSAVLQAGWRDLRRQPERLSGVVRVSAGDGFAELIAAAVQRFRRVHPQVQFELELDARVTNLGDREADLAVRTGGRREPSLIYRHLGDLRYGLWASRRFMRRGEVPPQGSGLRGVDVVGYLSPLHAHPAASWLESLGAGRPTVGGSTHGMVLAAAHAGAGIAALPDLSAQGLVRVWPGMEGPRLPVYLVSDRETLRQPHIRAFAQSCAQWARERLQGPDHSTSTEPSSV